MDSFRGQLPYPPNETPDIAMVHAEALTLRFDKLPAHRVVQRLRTSHAGGPSHQRQCPGIVKDPAR